MEFLLNERNLENIIRQLFPTSRILINAKTETQLRNLATGHPIELDIWIPKLQIAFEFQDLYHYTTAWNTQLTIDLVTQKDRQKRIQVESRGETLIAVPLWWDGTGESLSATIKETRPDLITELTQTGCTPIPLNPSVVFFRKYLMPHSIPDIGELMFAIFPPSTTPISVENSWWMGEKYDGIRCCWNSKTSQLYTRSGLEIVLPQILTDGFVPIHVDAEIWFGRSSFLASVKFIQSSSYPPHLEYFRIIAFDCPPSIQEEDRLAFEERYQYLLTHVPPQHPFLIISYRLLCKNRALLSKMIQGVVKDGGEGVILRKPLSIYENGKSTSLLKLKHEMCRDKEALVVRRTSNSFVLQWSNGSTFKVNIQDVKDGTKPECGDVVTVSYQRKLFSVDKNHFIERIRTDISWENVIGDFYRSTQLAAHLNSVSKPVVEYTTRKYGYWVHARRRQIRMMLEHIFLKVGLDPLIPQNWYSTSISSVKQVKEVKKVLNHFEGNLIKALLYFFPEIDLETAFTKQHAENQRKFFENYAKKYGFDPLNAENWYLEPIQRIMSFKGTPRVVFYQIATVPKTLLEIFPNIGLDVSKFPANIVMWRPENRRKFFAEYAEENGFDPENAENWYLQPRARIMSFKGAKSVMSYHEDSIPNALIDLFPNFGLERSKFPNTQAQWSDIETKANGFEPHVSMESNSNSGGIKHFPTKSLFQDSLHRRKFFEQYALENKFDPHNPENWYLQPADRILAKKGAERVIYYHNKSVTDSLIDLFHDIGLERSRFPSPSQRRIIENNRRFFENYAKDNGFDPQNPENWYSQQKKHIKSLTLKDSQLALSFHKNSVAQALLDLFPNIGLKKSKLEYESIWKEIPSRKRFFENYAKDHDFDPQNPTYWYSQPKSRIMSTKGAYRVMQYHKNSVSQALVDLFPNIGLDRSKFPNIGLHASKSRSTHTPPSSLAKLNS